MNQTAILQPDAEPEGSGPRDQIAALPARLREDGTVEVLLVTSRETRRWIIPKGWPMDGLADDAAAGVEAREEAGVKGKLLSVSIGRYAYWQRGRTETRFAQVDVFLLRVDKILKNWKEKGQRERRWFSVMEAADLVQEPELGQIFLRLAGQPGARRLLGLDRGKAARGKAGPT
ncbi:NUDIX hydrolase [Aureimonas sp. AU22]|uniref:NUDIX hydrolase n=1 Tax=Aureimonas sp. AU22 TaxID=1638162 RepID=UPI0009E85981|nr:NUDIX hydrolase [Aureimonas sp. AU22]